MIIINADIPKWRKTYAGGDVFKSAYLMRFSSRETEADFELRRSITYVPPFAKMAIVKIINSLVQRLKDVQRSGGNMSYQEAVVGNFGGVDNKGTSLLRYFKDDILPELCVTGYACVVMDSFSSVPLTQAENTKHPYLKTFQIECVDNLKIDWSKQPYEITEVRIATGDGTCVEYKYMKPGNVRFRKGKIDAKGNWQYSETKALSLDRVPVCVLKINQSLMTDIADYQIAAMNMASGDVNYCTQANYPLYIEPAGQVTVPGKEQKVAEMGVLKGRTFPITAGSPPDFIAPPSEPLMASMAKQKQMKDEINEALDMTLSGVSSTNSSAEAKVLDKEGAESGYFALAQELLFFEKWLVKCWMDFTSSTNDVTIVYPPDFHVKSMDQRLTEAAKGQKLIDAVPSLTAKRLIAQTIIANVLSGIASPEEIAEINLELKQATMLVGDPGQINKDVQDGILAASDAGKARCYPEGTSERAADEHAEKLKLLQEKQAMDPVGEKGAAQDPNLTEGRGKKTRGDAK